MKSIFLTLFFLCCLALPADTSETGKPAVFEIYESVSRMYETISSGHGTGLDLTAAYSAGVVLNMMIRKIFSDRELVASLSDQEMIDMLKILEENDKNLYALEEKALQMSLGKDNEAGRLQQKALELALGYQESRPLKKLLPDSDGEQKNLRLSGDLRLRFKSREYGDQDIQAALNRNSCESRMGLNIDIIKGKSFSLHTRQEGTGTWSSSETGWNENKDTFDHRETDFNTVLAFLEFKSRGLWTRAGRQQYTIGNQLLGRGIGEGILIQRSSDRSVLSAGGFKGNDSISGDRVSADNGLGLLFTEYSVNVDSFRSSMYLFGESNYRVNDMQTSFYLASLKNPFDLKLKPEITRQQSGMFDGYAGTYNYFGMALSGSLRTDLHLLGELCFMRWEEDLIIDSRHSNGDEAYLIGIKKDLPKNRSLKWSYLRMGDQFFRPFQWETDSFMHPGEEMLAYDAGYRFDFSDRCLEFSSPVNKRLSLTATYESIKDRRTLRPSLLPDDRTIMSFNLSGRLSQDSSLKLTLRNTSCNNNTLYQVVDPVSLSGSMELGNAAASGINPQIRVDDVMILRAEFEMVF
ncbi:MAG: hypothetical protein PHQ23_00075 [Candidatus Wallbacteria bacterium]|nr:hypothetical protein [Candidatus Wallbacteria bacterium]